MRLPAVCKINIASDIRLAMTGNIRKYYDEHPEHFDPRQYLKPARQAVKDMVARKIVNVPGSAGKANFLWFSKRPPGYAGCS